MTTVLYVFTTQDAEYVLGRKLVGNEAVELAAALNRTLTSEAANTVLDVASQVGPAMKEGGEPDKPICPRCGHFIPRDEFPGAYPGAISRVDNRTEVCSICGTDEAMGNGLVPKERWPIGDWAENVKAIEEAMNGRIRIRLVENAAAEGDGGEDGT